MNRFSSPKAILVAAVAFGALAAGSAAHARTDVHVDVAVGAQPAVVAVQPRAVNTYRPVYVQPQPAYVQPEPVYVQPRPDTWRDHRDGWRDHRDGWRDHRDGWRGERERGNPWGDADRDGVRNVYDRDWRYYDPRAAHRAAREARWGDADGDGVGNRFDRWPHNPYRR